VSPAVEPLASDGDAALSLRHWLGALPNRTPVQMRYDALDKARSLPVGASKRLLRKVVEEYGDWRLKEGDAMFLIEYSPRVIVVNRSNRG
jgi:hypothetical protein